MDQSSILDGLHRALPTKTSIRLLRKLEQTEARIRCSLDVVDLKDQPCYSALSYTWGNPQIDDEQEASPVKGGLLCNELAVTIQDNLYKALCHIQIGNDGYLWVDAICINQQDDEEKRSL
jgi:hypothetical protein